jgi:hypothetical protein
MRPYLAPGERSPFDISLQDVPEGAVQVIITVVVSDVNYTPYRSATIVQSTFGLSDYLFVQARNDDSQTMLSISVIATLYDASGRVVGAAPDARHRASADTIVCCCAY